MSSTTPEDAHTSRSTLLVMICTALSRILGFVRQAVISAVFGGEGVVDVYVMAFVIPNNLRNLLAEGALSSAFIPVLSKTLVEDPEKARARLLTSTLIAFQLLVLVPFILFCVVFSGPIAQVLLPFKEAYKQEMASQLFASLMPYLFFVSLSAVLMGTLNVHKRFGIPALAPLMFSITTIASIAIFNHDFFIYSIVIGVLAGGLLQLVVMMPSFSKLGYSLKPHFSFKSKDFRSVLRLWGPVITSSGIFVINEQVAVFFASGLSPGSPTAMTNALLFWQLPLGIFSASVTTVLFPQMSRHLAEGKKDEAKKTVISGLRSLIYYLVPSSVLLILLGKEVISLTLQHGAYLPEHTQLAANVLTSYSVGLLFVGSSRFLQRFFYASHENRTPLVSAFLIVGSDILASLAFLSLGLGVSGLGWANSFAALLGSVWLFIGVRKRLRGLRIRELALSMGKAILACVPSMVAVPLFLEATGPWWRSGLSPKSLIFLLAIGIFALASIVLMYVIMRVEVVDFILRRRKKK